MPTLMQAHREHARTWSAQLKRRREALGLTEAQVGRVLGVSARMVRYWEGGFWAPRPRLMRAWVKALGMDTSGGKKAKGKLVS